MGQLTGKSAIVTGGAAGLGEAIAQRLALEGANVVVTDVEEKLGQEVAEKYGITFLKHDVCDEARWRQVIGEVENRYGQLNIMVNNAGVLGPIDGADPENTTLASWRRVFSVNVEGVFLGCRAALPAMRRSGGGSIVNLSSISAFVATPFATAYGASKAAVRQLTKSVAQHCAHTKANIRCNSVHPGIVRTALWNRAAEEMALQRGLGIEKVVEEGRSLIPLGDFTLREDVASAVLFLVSDQARHVTGEALSVDGGMLNCDTYLR